MINKKQKVYGFDIDQRKIDLIKNNKSYISDISNKEIRQIKKDRIFNMKDNLKNISSCNYIILCLPTPLRKNNPDMSYIKNALKAIFPYLVKNQTIILESSVYPGATEEIFLKNKFKVEWKIFFNILIIFIQQNNDLKKIL